MRSFNFNSLPLSSTRRRFFAGTALTALLFSVAGCNRKQEVGHAPKAAPPTRISDADLTKHKAQ
jgi:hypothetical protein